MIDDRFSPATFARLGPNSAEVKRLADELAREIAVEMRETVEAAIRRVVEQVRGLGHDLKEFERGPCQYSYGPGEPAPPEQWLAIFFDVYVNACDLREVASFIAEQDKVSLATDDAVPF